MEDDLSGTFSISGRVTDRGRPVAGAAISAGDRTVITRRGGEYTLNGLPSGSYGT